MADAAADLVAIPGGDKLLARLIGLRTYGYRLAFIAYLCIFAIVMAPFWLKGEVISPDRQTEQLGITSAPLTGHIENRFFNDYSSVYAPELSVQLRTRRSEWIATWDPYNEFGRPLYHDAGFSPAYLPTRLLALFTQDPLRLLTLLSVLTALVGGVFGFQLARESGLHPVAAMVAAVFLSLSPAVLYWLAFPMFHSVFTWACGAIYAVTRLRKTPDVASWGLLAFCIYSLLMTGYQQDIVLHSYLMAGFGITAAFMVLRDQGQSQAIRFVLICVSAVAIGAACASPVYLDLLHRTQESARLGVDADFFLANLPKVRSADELLRLLASYFFQDVFGNPINPGFNHGTGDMYLPPLFFALATLTAVCRPKQTWGWWAAVVVFFFLTFCHPAYRFAVYYLGLNLSFSDPIYTAQIPLMMLAAYGADYLIRGTSSEPLSNRRRLIAVCVSSTLLVVMAALAVHFARADGLDPRWEFLLLATAVIACLALSLRLRVTAGLIALLAVSAYVHGRQLLLSQRPQDIAWTSPLVEDLRRNLPDEGRYAFLADLPVLGPNINSALGIRSVHTYNSLSSRRYQALVEKLGGATTIHGRHNKFIQPQFNDVNFALAGIAVVVAPTPVSNPSLSAIASNSGYYLYRVNSYRGCCLRIGQAANAEILPDRIKLTNLDGAEQNSISKTVDLGDRLEFHARPAAFDTFLILSQSYHPHWQASSRVGARDIPLSIVPVNGFFLGVRIPAGVSDIKLEFKPYVRYAWIGHVLFLSLLGYLVAAKLFERLLHRRNTLEAASDDKQP